MDAVIETIDVELRAVHAERHALKADFEQCEQRLEARRQALERAREVLLEQLSPKARRARDAARTRPVKGSDAEAIANLYPPAGSRTPGA
jgi:septal ring factor EnvC (AmiA/AmiB activator)